MRDTLFHSCRMRIETFDDSVAPDTFHLEVAQMIGDSDIHIIEHHNGETISPFISLSKEETWKLVYFLLRTLVGGAK